MKLTYRGVTYDYNPPAVSTTPAPATGTYRGVDVRFRNPAKPLVLQPTLDLKYRNVAYRTDGSPVAAPAPEAARPSMASRARALMMKRHVRMEKRDRVSLTRAAQAIGLGGVMTAVSNIQGKMQHDVAWSHEPSAASMS
ncbi:MAG: DUF4278 domain-containing protein [Cyanobacteria bacterium]|nr:DUF4278 domain-containing protein [Cyanobacteriota bacterium]